MRYIRLTILFVASFLVILTTPSQAADKDQPASKAVSQSLLDRMPVREIAVFKDGHAYIVHEGDMPTNSAGTVEMDYLPQPVLGTFWPYCIDPKAKLKAVTAGKRRVAVERTALEIPALLEANVGKSVLVTEVDGKEKYKATIAGFPVRTSEEQTATNPPNSEESLPKKGSLVLLKTRKGTKALPLARIQDVTFLDEIAPGQSEEEFRNLLTLKLDWQGGEVPKSAKVGLVYVQRGIRWIPNYKVAIDGSGKAIVSLQATLINELTDLENVRASLVIGVPSFAFKEVVDPISLQETIARLSSQFRSDMSLSNNFSNAIMTQAAAVPGPQNGSANAPATLNLGPDVADSGKMEDLFIFTLDGVSLKKGERMVVPIAQFDLGYHDIYTLDLPLAPPPELTRSLNSEQQREIAGMMANPKVAHKIRFENDSRYPLTTAPALILKGDRILAQGMMTYAPIGGRCDLDMTAAVNISSRKSDIETGRTPNAVRFNKNDYIRVDQEGSVFLSNFQTEPVEVEVTRYVLGMIDQANMKGKTEKWNLFDFNALMDSGGIGRWWMTADYPVGWSHLNGVSRITWSAPLKPSESIELRYAWHYYCQ